MLCENNLNTACPILGWEGSYVYHTNKTKRKHLVISKQQDWD